VRWALGSTARKILHHSPVPILVLRSDSPAPALSSADAARPFRALVALDGSALAESALVPAAHLVTALSAPATGALHLFEVVDPFSVGTPSATTPGERMPKDHDPQTAIQQDAGSYLQTIAERCTEGELATLGLRVTWSLRADRDVATTICQVAESGDAVAGTGVVGRCDVICMATHGRSGLERWMLGSITERVLDGARVPILVVPPHTEEASA
jgi:nucleotide-binding universal stress UspA family protein